MVSNAADRAALAERFREYRSTRDRKLRNELIEETAGLAHHLATRFANRGEPFEDLRQVALLGMLKAVERYDPDRGVEFATFASVTVEGELKRHFRDKTWAVHVPRGTQELHLRLAPLSEKLGHSLGRPPTIAELTAELGATEEQVLEALEAGAAYRAVSLEAPTSSRDGDGGGLERVLGHEDPLFHQRDQQMLVAKLLDQLPEREQAILRGYYFGELTQSEVAERVGISQMHVSRLLARALARLRVLLAAAEGEPGKPDPDRR